MEFLLDTGNTAWLLASASLVLLMTPAVAFFYGGMVRGKSVLNMLMMTLAGAAIASLIWALWGYSAAFGPSLGGIIGNPLTHFGLNVADATGPTASTGVPALVFAAFQATFAMISVALVAGAIADRVRFGTWLVFAFLWVSLVYIPLAHWVWGGGLMGPESWFARTIGLPIDIAGGLVVHIGAGASAFALALVVGRRRGFGSEPMPPHNLPFVLLGAGLLWLGWFGFNAGSELAADGTSGRAWINTLVAASAAMLAWLFTEKLRDGHPTSLGAASGIVAGLVSVTPAAGTVQTSGAILIGLIAGAVCALAVGLKYRFKYDDSLDVVGVHLVGGLIGTLMIGFLATSGQGHSVFPDGAQPGLFYGGGLTQMWAQTAAAVLAVVFAFGVTWVLATVLGKLMGWRVPTEVEVSGIDLAEHGERAYETTGSLIHTARFHTSTAADRIKVMTGMNTEFDGHMPNSAPKEVTELQEVQ
jgi:Amt family ammonium transporter